MGLWIFGMVKFLLTVFIFANFFNLKTPLKLFLEKRFMKKFTFSLQMLPHLDLIQKAQIEKLMSFLWSVASKTPKNRNI